MDGIKEVWEKSAAEERERLGAELRQREEKQRLEAEQREKEWLEAEEHQREQERLEAAQRLNKPKPFFRLRLIVAKLSVQLTICATIVITSGLILKAFYPGGSEPRPEPPRSISQDGSAFSGALQSEAEEIAKELFAGNYDTVRAKFSAGLSSNLSVQMMQQASQTYIKPLGNLNSTHPQPAKTDPNEQIVVNVICNADKGDLLVTVSFDQQAKVNGLWVKPI